MDIKYGNEKFHVGRISGTSLIQNIRIPGPAFLEPVCLLEPVLGQVFGGEHHPQDHLHHLPHLVPLRSHLLKQLLRIKLVMGSNRSFGEVPLLNPAILRIQIRSDPQFLGLRIRISMRIWIRNRNIFPI